MREQVAKALFGKGFTLGTVGRNAEAIATYDALLAQFGDAWEPVLREQVAMALYNKGFTLGALDRSAEEIAAYDALLAKFGDATEPLVLEIISNLKSVKEIDKERSMMAAR